MGKGTGNTTVKTIKSSYFCTGSDTIQNKQKNLNFNIFKVILLDASISFVKWWSKEHTYVPSVKVTIHINLIWNAIMWHLVCATVNLLLKKRCFDLEYMNDIISIRLLAFYLIKWKLMCIGTADLWRLKSVSGPIMVIGLLKWYERSH